MSPSLPTADFFLFLPRSSHYGNIKEPQVVPLDSLEESTKGGYILLLENLTRAFSSEDLIRIEPCPFK